MNLSLELSGGIHQCGECAQRGGFAAKDAAAKRADLQPGLGSLPDLLRLKAALRTGQNGSRAEGGGLDCRAKGELGRILI